MKTTTQKSAKKSFNVKAAQKFVWTLATTIGEQINNTLITAARSNKISISEKDLALLTVIITSAAESTIAGATKTLISSLQNEK